MGRKCRTEYCQMEEGGGGYTMFSAHQDCFAIKRSAIRQEAQESVNEEWHPLLSQGTKKG